MAITNKIRELISKYILLKETDNERKELYTWYNNLKTGKEITSSEIRNSFLKSKKRLFNEIQPIQKRFRYKMILWQSAAAILIVSISGYLYYNHFKRDADQLLKNSEIDAIMPQPQKVILSFSNGKIINPDTMVPLRPVVVGKNLMVRKNDSGTIIFDAAGKNDEMKIFGTLKTLKASQQTVILSDGTKVYLNANSQLTFPGKFANADREVKLQGEGYFEVIKTLRHTKFYVRTDEETVKVLGTKFNIKIAENKFVKTSLIEGSVSITPKDESFHPVVIKPNQQAILQSSGIQVSKTDAVKAVGWKEGFFVFNGDNTAEMLIEIAKWYDLELDTQNIDHLKEHTGRIPSTVSLGQLVDLLNYTGINVKVYKKENGKLKLTIL